MKTILKLSILTAAMIMPAAAQDAAAEHPGKAIYATCSACHQPTGAGIPGAFPPLAESEWVNGPVENLIRIQLRGLMGEITVKGVKYNSVMPPNAAMTDKQIADVLTYVRSNFGNKSGAVTEDQVKALRGEVGKPMLKEADLIDPKKVEEKAKEEPKAEAPAEAPKKDEAK